MQLDPPIALLEGNRDTDLVMLGATARVQTDDLDGFGIGVPRGVGVGQAGGGALV